MRRFLTLLAAGIATVLIPASLYAFNLQRTLLEPDLYREVLASDQVYQALIGFLGDSAASVAEEEGVRVSARELEELESLAAEALPPDWFESQVEANVDAIFVWLGSDEPLPDLGVDLREVKPRLVPVIRHAILRRWETLPACDHDGPPTLDEEGDPVCRPPGMSLQRFLSLAGIALEREIAEALREVPDRLTLADLGDESSQATPREFETALQRVRNFVRLIRAGTLVLLSSTGLTMLVLALLAATSAASFLGWIGGTLLAGGIAAAIPALAAQSWVDRALANMARGGGAEGRAAVGLIQSTLSPLAEALASSVIGQGLVVAAAGAVALATGVVLGLLPRSASPVPSPTGKAEPKQAG